MCGVFTLDYRQRVCVVNNLMHLNTSYHADQYYVFCQGYAWHQLKCSRSRQRPPVSVHTKQGSTAAADAGDCLLATLYATAMP
jgi:hypothetical protein